MIYILTGGPATGKGTRSDILAKALNIPHISTGDMLREKAQKDEELKASLSRGELVPDSMINALLEERITRKDCVNGFVLDGYPRTYAQAVELDRLFEKYGLSITKVMELVVPDELAFKRILERKKCDNCGEQYGIDFPPEVDDVCDKCGGHLSIRTDDTKETLAKRINTYRENAKEILDYYRDKGLLYTYDASHNPESVVEDALN
ncbi:MAG: nucleoside monophosphate kinase [Clostridia bacterium]|nr:nucleoside monophosphate kinase [Clostridia bacterium]